ncbi:30S ribosomal protein S6 [Mycoplasma tauri]|uniref:Small ribosomal subunit protein bS6 n=1 Tax=Mycoplasma tauri TaxID=547987 RepID=A0A953T9G9_9MOLU|nr:30S ribosomal protein S6 [Mycoplasma tauri]MBZ4195254.1 30S ribosomal protein S6 [Mycoplasma tauri]MBZ4218213.1 30S ribosomal protein S6 [Mycoplasma tauri]MBZ4226947.1 30S ribosomal protein S6 [Mycoplasma tauri]
MNKYEIMLIIDPAVDALMATNVVESVFDKKYISKAEKMENTTLAYPINKSTKAQYMIYNLEAESSLIAEFVRKANIAKFIWRHMIINLDSEKGFGKSKKAYKTRIAKDARTFSKTAGTRQLVENLEKAVSTKSPKTATVKKPAIKN